MDTDTLHWVGGHLDGDGTIGVYNGRLRVMVQKSIKAQKVVDRLKHLFGGVIIVSPSKHSTREDRLQWVLRAKNAQEFAAVIAPYTVTKRPQFAAVADLRVGRVSKIDKQAVMNKRKALEDMLKEAKQIPHAEITEELSLPYIAGFFDADGHLAVIGSQMHIQFSQKYRPVLDKIQLQHGGRVTPMGPCFELRIRRQQADDLLQAMTPFLFEKLDQASCILGCHGNYGSILEQIKQMRGRQKM